MVRVVITGGAGFLGSHLCDRLLERGDEVVVLDNLSTGAVANIEHLFERPGFSFVQHDVSNYVWVPGAVDLVMHFASPASPVDYLELPIQTLKVGSLGTHNTLGLAKAKGAKFFLASTSEVYGDPEVHPQPESYWGRVNPIGTRSCYDEGKRCAETLFFDYHRQHRIKIKVARIFNTYGPRMHPNDGRVVSNFIIQAIRNEPITVYGDGSQTRSFCYVDDMVDGLIRLMNSPDGFTGPVNLENPEEISILELAEKIIKMTGSRSKIILKTLPADDPRQRKPDITLAKEKLGWSPKTPLEEGLTKTIQYFDDLLSEGLKGYKEGEKFRA
jgi:UDP-glucuronate decarboxylase